jgi:hypothetical protein
VAFSAFGDKSRPPEPAALRRVLGASAKLWFELVSHVTEKHAPVTEQWNFSGVKFGWSLRLKRPERVVLYMTPQAGAFSVGVVLGEKAAKAAHQSGLPDSILEMIDSAPRYAEGRGIRMVVASPADVLAVQKLAAVKMAP